MGALVSISQRDDVRARIARAGSRRRAHRRRRSQRRAADRRRCVPAAGAAPHRRPVGHRAPSTTASRSARSRRSCPTSDMADAIALANRGKGSLVLSLFTHSPEAARDFVQGAAAYHGRMLVLNRDNAAEMHRPRLAAPGPRPRRPRPRRRQRGDGRRARRQALHAAHRAPVHARDDRRDHRAICPRRAQAHHRRPPVPPEDERAPHRRHLEDRQPHRHARGHRAFRRVHRRQILRAHGRGSGQGLADLRGPRGPRLSDPEFCRGPVRRSRSRARCSPIPASRICAS